ncbi:MAG TPA: M6 family metalloprotease domain-containing protein [Gemmatimonadaceae bacterium]|nr:M6 family metalloprotease domain-containing protein [Gemmatimonadaceae bacterium]
MKTLLRVAIVAAAAALPLVAHDAGAQDIVKQAKKRGLAVPRGYYAQKKKDPNAFEFRRAWKSAMRRAKTQRAMMRSSGLSGTSAAGSSGIGKRAGVVSGTFRVPVLPFLYSNSSTTPYDYSILQFKLFGAGSATQETVTHVYGEMSRGLLNLTGTVRPWSRVSNTDSYYEGSKNGLNADAHLGALFKEVLDSADRTIDFSQYDSDGDGFVDFVAFVQPEFGGECGGTANNNLWSHRYTVEAWFNGAAYQTNDIGANGQPVKVADYVLQPALNCTQLGGGPIDIGVFAHEFGHAFGLPDLYSTADGATNEGIGEWGLMGAGNWNTPASPSHMEAWSKMEMGWVPVVTVSRDTTITLPPIETSGAIVRLDIPGTSEYFLLENREKIGSDAQLHGTGLLVFHVDSNTVNTLWATNTIQNETGHKGLDVVEADGLNGLDNAGYRGTAADIFPGSRNVTSLTPSTSPNTNSYNNAGTTIASGVSITGIVQSGTDVTFTLSFGASGPVAMKWGDLTGDGVVSAADYSAAYNCLVGASCPGTISFGRADVDGDTKFTATDALIIHSYVIGGVDVSRYRVGQAVTTPVPPIAAPVLAVPGAASAPASDGTLKP